MGAAIEVFEGARTIEVGRDRFVPVKTTDDLLVLRSDVYDLGRTSCSTRPPTRCPTSTLDGEFYKLVGDFDKRFPEGAPVAARGRVVHRRRRLDLRPRRQGRRRRRARARRPPSGSRAAPSSSEDEQTRRWLTCCRSPTTSSGSSPRSRRCRTFPQPLMEALGLALAEDVRRPDLAAELRQLLDGRLRRGRRRRRRRHRGRRRCTCRSSARSAPASRSILALSPGTAVKIMTGAPVPAGATTVVPYEWTDRGVAQVRIDRARHARPAHPAHAATTSPRATCCSRRAPSWARATSACSPRSAARPSARRPRPRVVVISTGSELRDPGTPLGHDSIYDGNSYLLAAAARAAGAIAYRVGIVPDESHAFTEALERPAGPRRHRRHQRGSERGRLRRRQGVAVAARHDVVRRGRACSRASRRASAPSARTTPRSSRCRATRSRRTSPSRCSCCPRSAG